MKRFAVVRAVIAAVLAVLVVTGWVPPSPAAAATPAIMLPQLKARAIYFLQKGSATQRGLAVDSMANVSPWEGQLWQGFLASWESTNNYMKMNSSVVEGLPRTGHVFVVLGSALTSSGGMTAKLERRMKLALTALAKYPTSKVLVSGGASRNGKTEAQVMRSWLVARGVASSRILVEDKSFSTIGNAKYSMQLLSRSTEYTSYTLITDSSHMRRASVLFDAAAVLVQAQSGKAWPIKPESNVAYLDLATAGQQPLSASSVAYTASNVAYVLGVLSEYKALVASPPAPATLTSIKVTAPTKATYEVGEVLDSAGLDVTAFYSDGAFSRSVTGAARVTRFSTDVMGEASARVTYTELGVTKSASFPYSVVKAWSKTRMSLSTTTLTQSSTRVVVKVKVSVRPGSPIPTGKVRFYLDGTRIKTIFLSAEQNGVAKLRYPAISKVGEHRVKVTYVGDATHRKSTRGYSLTVTA